MTTWKPGDVTKVAGMPAMFTGSQRRSGRWVFADGSSAPEDHVPAPRPLVVIDPGSAEDIDRLCDLIAEDVDWLALQAALREFAAPTPPKPAEPTGHYAVIEDTRGVEWCLTGWDTDYPWQAHYQDGSGESTTYAEIDAVRVLSEGIQ